MSKTGPPVMNIMRLSALILLRFFLAQSASASLAGIRVHG